MLSAALGAKYSSPLPAGCSSLSFASAETFSSISSVAVPSSLKTCDRSSSSSPSCRISCSKDLIASCASSIFSSTTIFFSSESTSPGVSPPSGTSSTGVSIGASSGAASIGASSGAASIGGASVGASIIGMSSAVLAAASFLSSALASSFLPPLFSQKLQSQSDLCPACFSLASFSFLALHLQSPSHLHASAAADFDAFLSPSDLLMVLSGRCSASVCEDEEPASISFGSLCFPPPQPRPSL